VTAKILDSYEFMRTNETPARRLPHGRSQLVQTLAGSGDVVRISDVERTLDVSRVVAAKRLSRWAEQGWLKRVGVGAYVAASLDTLGSERILDDPWVLIPSLFGPAYVGGRTAMEHWDLTEQIFKDVVVVTGRAIRRKSETRQGFRFTLKHIHQEKIFGTKSVWRRQTKVQVSDVPRTIVDVLDDPALGGGIQHVSDGFDTYLRHADRNDQKLIEYAERLGNGAVFKRLGFLAELRPDAANLAESCRARLTAGNAKLDPALGSTRLVSKWRLFVPPSWDRGDHP
jgi:predicted transcriptional regulator of viral defense system